MDPQINRSDLVQDFFYFLICSSPVSVRGSLTVSPYLSQKNKIVLTLSSSEAIRMQPSLFDRFQQLIFILIFFLKILSILETFIVDTKLIKTGILLFGNLIE